LPDDPVTRWARDVVRGQIVAGDLVCHSAERHLKDLREGGSRGLFWSQDKADHALGFFPEVLTITAGSKEGEPFVLLPWTMFCVGSLFGWRTEDGGLRFRSSWWETGKGQAKSPAMAAVGLYLMGYYGIARSEVYAIAWDKDQANVLFKDAVAMCRAPIPGTDPDEGDSLEHRGEVVIRGRLDHAWRIEHPATGSKFQSLANGDAISGPRPTAVLADEIHEFKDGAALELWKRAIAKMPGDALMLLGTNTPASTQIVGTQYSEFYQKVAKGEVVDDTAFSFVARVDKDDTPFEDEACWPKALPALGITFPVANIRREVSSAKLMLSTKMSVGRLYFGIPIGAVEFWIAEEAWAAVQGDVDLDEMRGKRCWLSLDLSQKNDLTALSACFEGELNGKPHLWVKTWYWTTKAGLADRALADNAPYDLWVAQGHLAAVGGAVIDKTFAAAEVKRLVSEHDVQYLAFDPAGIDDFIAACDEVQLQVWKWEGPKEPQGRGLKLVRHNQGKRVVFEQKQLCMPHSIERLEDRILEKSITIDASPVTYSCAANAFVDSDAQNNRCFDKRRSRGRIDGMVTIAMAVGAATAEAAPERKYQMMVF
jgi:phage terminase large subunit-like protein